MNKHGSDGNLSGRSHPVHLDNPLARKLEHFARLSVGDRVQLAAALSPIRTIAARADIREEGDDPRSVNVILDGWACRYRQLPNGQRQIVSLLLPGDPCDPQAFEQRRVHHAIGALTPVSLAQIRGSAMKELTTRNSALDEAFLHERLSATAIQYEWTVSLGRRSAIERLAHLFCELYARLDAVGLADGASCPMLLTQTDLANALGQTSVHINRTLKELRGMELIALQSRRLTITHHAKLQALAMFEPTYVLDDEAATSAPRR